MPTGKNKMYNFNIVNSIQFIHRSFIWIELAMLRLCILFLPVLLVSPKPRHMWPGHTFRRIYNRTKPGNRHIIWPESLPCFSAQNITFLNCTFRFYNCTSCDQLHTNIYFACDLTLHTQSLSSYCTGSHFCLRSLHQKTLPNTDIQSIVCPYYTIDFMSHWLYFIMPKFLNSIIIIWGIVAQRQVQCLASRGS